MLRSVRLSACLSHSVSTMTVHFRTVVTTVYCTLIGNLMLQVEPASQRRRMP